MNLSQILPQLLKTNLVILREAPKNPNTTSPLYNPNDIGSGDDEVAIRVVDQGIGIPESSLDELSVELKLPLAS